MKPNKVILDTDFYQLASDGFVEVEMDVPSGTAVGDNAYTKDFKVGSADSDFTAMVFVGANNKWYAGRNNDIYANTGGRVGISILRRSSNNYRLRVETQALSAACKIKARIKTFLWPEL